jgi:hypothetical protein
MRTLPRACTRCGDGTLHFSTDGNGRLVEECEFCDMKWNRRTMPPSPPDEEERERPIRFCRDCGVPYQLTSNHRRYCAICQGKRTRQRNREDAERKRKDRDYRLRVNAARRAARAAVLLSCPSVTV